MCVRFLIVVLLLMQKKKDVIDIVEDQYLRNGMNKHDQNK